MMRFTWVLMLVGAARLAAQSGDAAAPAHLVELQAQHYAAVEEELAAADVSALDPAQCASRAWVIAELARYRERRVFGQGASESLRVPAVRDAGGRLCAVAQIVWNSGAHELIDRLATSDNSGWIVELMDDPGLGAWAQRMGVTPVELARIHAPAVAGPPPTWSTLKPENPLSAGKPKNPGAAKSDRPSDLGTGPSTTPGQDPRSVRGDAGPAAAAGARPTAHAVPERPMGTGGASLDCLTGGEAMDDWWLWWEINKTRYLVSRREEPAAVVSPYTTGMETVAQRRARLSVRLMPLLHAALGDEAACVRAAAATTLGRLGGEPAVDALLETLDDNSMEVREAALLALGATGSARAASSLLHIADDGHLSGVTEAIGPAGRPLAIMGLGLARQRGLDASVDPMVAAIAECGEVDVEEAALLFGGLTGARDCDDLAERLAEQRSLDIRVRCRVTEALHPLDDARLPAALDELGEADTDRRRAAAVTLARSGSVFALPQLQTAFELEEEPLTRGLLLLSIGEQGGDAARLFLQRQLRRGRSLDRPWVALALGLVGRGGDERAREALREGLADRPTSATLGAWLLACGLARDPQAVPALSRALVEVENPRDRMLAALALSMVRDRDALKALRSRLDVEISPLARVGVVLGVALFSHAQDAERLVAELRDARDPEMQGQLAAALGVHDTSAAADGLMALLEGARPLSDSGRAAALDALGLLLDPHGGLQLVRASAGRNFAVFPDWLARALTTTTL